MGKAKAKAEDKRELMIPSHRTTDKSQSLSITLLLGPRFCFILFVSFLLLELFFLPSFSHFHSGTMGQSHSTLAPPPPPATGGIWGVPYWILASTNKALGDLGGSIVSVTKLVIGPISGLGRKSSSPSPSPPPSLSSQMIVWVRNNTGKALLGTLLVGIAVVVGSTAYKSLKLHPKLLKNRKVIRGPGGSKREVIGRCSCSIHSSRFLHGVFELHNLFAPVR